MARPRTPSAILEQRGAFEVHPERKRDGEPIPDGTAVKPKFVKGAAARIWAEYAPRLLALKLLTSVDAHTFGAWCCLTAELEKDSEKFTASRYAQWRALGERFGLDPSSRARMSIKDTVGTEDPAEKYFSTYRPGNEVRQ
jgi:phage terminase small subunit